MMILLDHCNKTMMQTIQLLEFMISGVAAAAATPSQSINTSDV